MSIFSELNRAPQGNVEDPPRFAVFADAGVLSRLRERMALVPMAVEGRRDGATSLERRSEALISPC